MEERIQKIISHCGVASRRKAEELIQEGIVTVNGRVAELGMKADIKWLERHPADVEATWANIGKAKNILKWSPGVKIEEGIERTVKWYKENRDFILSLREVE